MTSEDIFLLLAPFAACISGWAVMTAFRRRTYRDNFNKFFSAKIDFFLNIPLVFFSVLGVIPLLAKVGFIYMDEEKAGSLLYFSLIMGAAISGARLSRLKLAWELEIDAQKKKSREMSACLHKDRHAAHV